MTMLKVVVFDSGYGGELFADKLEEELPVVEVIRVIDWRNADKLLQSPKTARRIAMAALERYIGRVDLIVFANHLLSITSLKYFQKKYKDQKFIGLLLKTPDTYINRRTIILTTKAVYRTAVFYNFAHRLKRNVQTVCLDSWPALIDDGELTTEIIATDLADCRRSIDGAQVEIILACSQFSDCLQGLRQFFGGNVKIYDSFDDCLRAVCKTLKIRGCLGRKS